MTATEIMNALFSLARPGDFSQSCDTCKAGDPHREVNRVAVTMFPTPDVLRAAAQWGAELLIVHEPMYYNHMDHHSDEPVEQAKRALVEQTGMTIWRFHDHPHATRPDIIAAGQLRSLGLEGEMELTDDFDKVVYHTKQPITPRQLQRLMEQNWGLRNVRLCGSKDKPCQRIFCMFGAPGKGAFDELKKPECEIMLIGEACEWSMGEYARDADQLGFTKALMILGHEGSEREGMVYTAHLLQEMVPSLEVKYLESEEVY